MSIHRVNISAQLKKLQSDLFDYTQRNPFVQINPEKLWFPQENGNFKQAEKIHSRAIFFEKEYALKTVLQVESFVRWKTSTGNTFNTSPLLYRPAALIKKVREEVSFSVETDESLFSVNPMLQKIFQEEFQLSLPSQTQEPESIYALLEHEFKHLQRQSFFDGSDSWQLITRSAVGIFNYKKLLLVSDYEKIIQQPGDALLALFGEKETVISKQSAICPFEHALDRSQQDAVRTALNEHTVIQGPPGTGKSHTTVNLIKSFLIQKKKVLFVSEKRAALDVVFQKLKKEKLDLCIAYFNSEKNEKKQFYAHLKKSWEKATDFNSNSIIQAPDLPVFNDLLDYYPYGLTAKTDLSEMSLNELEEALLNGHETNDPAQVIGSIPSYPIWLQHLPFLLSFEKKICDSFKVHSLQETSFLYLNSSVFSDKNPLRQIQQRLRQLEQYLNACLETCARYQIQATLAEVIRYAVAASVLNMVNKNQLDLLQPDHKKYKAFSTLAKKFQLTQLKLHQAEQLNQKWTKKPTISEITELTELLKQKKKPKSILGILKRNAAKSYDYFSDFSEELTTVSKLQLLEEVRSEWHLRNDLDELRVRLKHELHILHPETEIDHILQVRNKLQSIHPTQYQKILEHPNSLQMIRDLDQLHGIIHQLSGILSYLGLYQQDQFLQQFIEFCAALNLEIPTMEHLEAELKKWFNLPYAIHQVIQKNQGSISHLNARLIKQQIQTQSRFVPQYKMLSGENLMSDFQKRKRFFKEYDTKLNTVIQTAASGYLKAMEKLAETPTARLKTASKSKRKSYKESKRILVHELLKKQRHLPVQELMRDSSELILNLQPVWMMNPLSVSQHVPDICALFDVVIFDEASQIPLEDAIPAIFRGGHLIVAGDSHQMPPSRFFSSRLDGTTLLDQASFNLTSRILTHHYRSQHPALIAFSNRHFYDNELLALPPSKKDKALDFIFVNGIFDDHKNNAEAKSVAAYYQTLLLSGKKNIGILAFSVEQQLEIEKQIHQLNLPVNDQLMVRNLENIQGNEKEIILISVGYARNKAGVFRKTFGPINQEQGANRLNVLLTRAIQKMVVFSSVRAADFGISENTGISLLSDFLKFAEEGGASIFKSDIQSTPHQLVFDWLTKNQLDFEYYSSEAGLSISAFVNHSYGKILLVNPCLENELDLYSTLSALQNRFEDILILTNTDLISNRKLVEKQVLHFFGFPARGL